MANKKSVNGNASAAPPVPAKSVKPKLATSEWVKYYLLAYNVLSTMGWASVLILTLVHLTNLDGKSGHSRGAPSAPSSFARVLSSIPFFRSSTSGLSFTIESRLPSYLQPIYRRSTTSYSRIGNVVAVVQTCATLEVGHVLLGWVRSPLQTTAMQVASRLWAIYLVHQFEVARTNPLYTSAVLAWSLTEVVRYSFYASNLLGYEPPVLLYLRYTMFYVLYPIGASSEAFLNYSTLPIASGISTWRSFLGWTAAEYFRAGLFLLWWPSLYQLYTHMMVQRRKIIGGLRPKSKTN
ncbi:PTPLA-domain-containing protein [Mycena belliarum]|uniref:Very-long-chain (3R)-3-hydroxyacyl-CoA dehydratase n=1 Tax=Mycena belliarum TaxID=1033014 RepID=A0AAD6U365_9AGAR|nr:PTPLA-domain-containing protein [Mycena belliae]